MTLVGLVEAVAELSLLGVIHLLMEPKTVGKIQGSL